MCVQKKQDLQGFSVIFSAYIVLCMTFFLVVWFGFTIEEFEEKLRITDYELRITNYEIT